MVKFVLVAVKGVIQLKGGRKEEEEGEGGGGRGKKKNTLWARQILLPSRHFGNFAQILEVCLFYSVISQRERHTHKQDTTKSGSGFSGLEFSRSGYFN